MMTLLVGVLGSIMAAEIYMWLPALANWLVRYRAAKLERSLSERMVEEWTGELAFIAGHVGKIIFAVGLFVGTDRMESEPRSDVASGGGDVTVAITGVSATGAVGTLTPIIDALDDLSWMSNHDTANNVVQMGHRTRNAQWMRAVQATMLNNTFLGSTPPAPGPGIADLRDPAEPTGATKPVE